MVIKVPIVKVEKQGRIMLPKDVRDRLGIRSGGELVVEQSKNGVLLRPRISPEGFAAELKGCVKGGAVNPLELKKIWKM